MRNSRMELLRLIGMYFVVLAHESAFGIRNLIFPLAPQDMTFNVCLNYVLNFPGTAFNLIFIILAGYYGIHRRPSYKRISVLAVQECFYAWILAIIVLGGGLRALGQKDVLQAAFPLFTGYNWFINCYIVLMLIAPFLNKMILALSRRDLFLLIAVLFTLRILNTAAGMETFVVVGRNLEVFVFCYLIGAYMRLYPNHGRVVKAGMIDAAIVIITYSLSVFIMGYLFRVTGNSWYVDHMTILLEPAKILTAIYIFQIVVSQEPFYNSGVNRIAEFVPGIYLLHENRLLRPYIWTAFAPTLPLLNSVWFVPGMMLKAAIVMLLCIALNIPWEMLIKQKIRICIDYIAHECIETLQNHAN